MKMAGDFQRSQRGVFTVTHLLWIPVLYELWAKECNIAV